MLPVFLFICFALLIPAALFGWKMLLIKRIERQGIECDAFVTRIVLRQEGERALFTSGPVYVPVVVYQQGDKTYTMQTLNFFYKDPYIGGKQVQIKLLPRWPKHVLLKGHSIQATRDFYTERMMISLFLSVVFAIVSASGAALPK